MGARSNSTNGDWSCDHHIETLLKTWVLHAPSMHLRNFPQKLFLFVTGNTCHYCLSCRGRNWDECRGSGLLCLLQQHLLLKQMRCILHNSAGQHHQRNGFCSLLPWWWSYQTSKEMSNGAGNIMPYAEGLWDNNEGYGTIMLYIRYLFTRGLPANLWKRWQKDLLKWDLLLGEQSVFKIRYLSLLVS